MGTGSSSYIFAALAKCSRLCLCQWLYRERVPSWEYSETEPSL